MRRGSVEHMNKARASKPASGGRNYSRIARKAHYAAVIDGSWDALLTQTQARWHRLAGRSIQDYQDATGRGSMLTASDIEFIENGGF